MSKFNVYLNFNGNTEEAFNFYKSVFGGEFTALMRFKDTPDAGKLPRNELDKIMHVSLPIGNGNTLMATDILPSMGQRLTIGNNFSLSISVDHNSEVDALYKALCQGGKVLMEPQNTFWGAYFCQFTDKYGIQWMVECEKVQATQKQETGERRTEGRPIPDSTQRQKQKIETHR